jgi:4-amino-4-deoxy-L-arabinose transferase-like glycosyltransferase
LIPLLLLVVSALLLFWHLGDIEMRRYDESLYALRAKEMCLSGHLLAPMQGGKVAWSSGKPPFGFWLIILSFRLFGLNPLALRLPFAVAGIGCIVLLYFIGQRLKDARLGLFSALSLLLMPGFLKFSRQAILEPLLTFFFLATLLFFHQSHSGIGKKAIPYGLASGLAIGLAILTKQVVGLVILPALLIYEVYSLRKRGGMDYLPRWLSLLLAMIGSSIWWFLLMYGRYGPIFIQQYFWANVLRRVGVTITARETMARGFHSALLRHTSSFTLLIGTIGLSLLLLLLLLPTSPRTRFSRFRLQAESLLLPFLLFSGTYYLIFAGISRTFLWWYPFPLFPILALGQGYFLWACLEASYDPRESGWPFQLLALCLPVLTWAFALSHGLHMLLIPLTALFFLYLVMLWKGSGKRADGQGKPRPALLPTLALCFPVIYFSLAAHSSLQAPTYHSPDYFQQIASQVKALSPAEVLFDESVDHERKEKVSRFRFYLDVPVRTVKIEPYLKGEGDGKRRVLFTSPKRWKTLEKSARRARTEEAAGGEFLLLQMD